MTRVLAEGAAPSPPDTSKGSLLAALWICMTTLCLWEQKQISSLQSDNASKRDRQRPALKGPVLLPRTWVQQATRWPPPIPAPATWIISNKPETQHKFKNTRPICGVFCSSRWMEQGLNVRTKASLGPESRQVSALQRTLTWTQGNRIWIWVLPSTCWENMGKFSNILESVCSLYNETNKICFA